MPGSPDDAARLRTLSAVQRTFAEAATDYERVLDVVARQVATVVHDGCVVRLLSDDGWLRCVASQLPLDGLGLDAETAAAIHAFVEEPHNVSEHAWVRRVVETGEAVLVPTLERSQLRNATSPEVQRVHDALRMRSLLFVAMRVRGQTIGVLAIIRFLPGSEALDERDLELAQTLADHAALAIANARLYADLQRELAERRRVEAALRSSEENLRLLVDGARDYAMMLLDPAGRIVTWNAGAERIKGYRASEIIGTSHDRFYRPDDVAAGNPARLLEAARANGRAEDEGPRVRKDGSVFHAAVTVTALKDPAGAHVGFAKITRDLTERQKLEEQLRQGQKMEAIGQLAGGVAHDFNNILSVILSYSQMLGDELRPDDPMRADLEEIRVAGTRATELTRQLLAFGRQQILQPRAVNLNQLVSAIERMLRRLIDASIEFTFAPSPTLGTTVLDRSQVDQILINLVVNARDAMPRGGKLTIETANVTLDDAYAAHHVGVAPGRYVMLAVSDTGVGMDAATQARIFEPFFTTKARGQGTGLGLATVYGIVRQSEGHIWVYSEPGKGTTFKVYFPRSDQGVGATEPIALLPVRGGTETILLVEDDERVRLLARTILERHGYHVLEALSGGDALLLCEQHGATIHLLLTDVVMPRMSGRQLADRLAPLRPAMKVLYMSGYTSNAIVHHGVLDSDVHFLPKPFTPESLLRKVREVLASED